MAATGRRGGRAVDAERGPVPHGRDVTGGLRLQRGHTLEGEARPDFSLPPAIERFDGGLQAGLPRRGEDGGEAEPEAQAHHAAHGVAMLMRALEDIVVIELDVAGKADRAPVREQELYGAFRGHRQAGPGPDQAPVEGDHGQHFDVGAAAPQVQALDDVDAIEFDLALGDGGQVPSPRRWRPADAAAAVEGAAPLEDTSQRTHGRHGRLALGQQNSPDRRGPEFAEIARCLQFVPDPKDTVLDVTEGSASMMRPRGSTGPLHVIQRPMPRASDPELHG